MAAWLVLFFMFFIDFRSVASAVDFDDCARAARNLKNAAEEAESAQRDYESAKSNHESACSSYGYDKDNASACGRYGYHRSPLDSTRSRLESKVNEVSNYASTVSTRCEFMSPTRINLMNKLAQELQNTKRALQDCQQASPK